VFSRRLRGVAWKGHNLRGAAVGDEGTRVKQDGEVGQWGRGIRIDLEKKLVEGRIILLTR
jgi:hypothetical protein